MQQIDIRNPSHIEAALPLAAELPYPQLVRSLLAGHTSGWVWVDQRERPRVLLAWDGGSNVFLACRREMTSRSLGIALCEEVQRTLEQDVFAMAALAGLWGFVLQYGPRHQAEPLVREMLRGHESVPDTRHLFTLDADAPLPEVPEPPAGVALRPVNAQLLQETHLAHHAELLAWIDENWPSREHFLEYGFGFVAAEVGRVLGWCCAEALTNDACGIGIETVEGARRRGYGYLMGAAFLGEARRRGLQPWWDAWRSNVASRGLAARLGMREATQYGLRFAWYNRLDNAVVHLRMALRRGDSRAAIGWLKRVLRRAATPQAETARLWPDPDLERQLLDDPHLAAILARGV